MYAYVLSGGLRTWAPGLPLATPLCAKPLAVTTRLKVLWPWSQWCRSWLSDWLTDCGLSVYVCIRVWVDDNAPH